MLFSDLKQDMVIEHHICTEICFVVLDVSSSDAIIKSTQTGSRTLIRNSRDTAFLRIMQPSGLLV